jgi:DNA replication protein DnaC
LTSDELGYLPPDKRGAELLFQVIAKRYERGSIIITTNIAFKDWPRIFAGDAPYPVVAYRTNKNCPFLNRQNQTIFAPALAP